MSDASLSDPAQNAAPGQAETPAEEIIWIDGYAAPVAPPLQPFHALAAVVKLILNKEDTRQVFEIIRALTGRGGQRLFQKFLATDYGRRVVTEPVLLEHILTDRERLRALPADTVGRAYLAFMEGEELTPEGILDASREAGIDHDAETQCEEYRRLFLHLQVSHDLWHVLTGYGRDALGEICNLIYTARQTRNRGLWLIVAIGALAQKLEKPGAPILKAMREADRRSKRSAWVLGVDVQTLLAMPLHEARAHLNLGEPTVYDAIPASLKDSLLKPKIAKTQSEREGGGAQSETKPAEPQASSCC